MSYARVYIIRWAYPMRCPAIRSQSQSLANVRDDKPPAPIILLALSLPRSSYSHVPPTARKTHSRTPRFVRITKRTPVYPQRPLAPQYPMNFQGVLWRAVLGRREGVLVQGEGEDSAEEREG